MSPTDCLVLGVLLGINLSLFLVVTLVGGWLLQDLSQIAKKTMTGRVLPRVLGLLAALAFQFLNLMSALSTLSRIP